MKIIGVRAICPRCKIERQCSKATKTKNFRGLQCMTCRGLFKISIEEFDGLVRKQEERLVLKTSDVVGSTPTKATIAETLTKTRTEILAALADLVLMEEFTNKNIIQTALQDTIITIDNSINNLVKQDKTNV